MTRVLKTLLLWLLIAALPIQGMAAVVKASCGPTHHAMPPAMDEQAVPAAAPAAMHVPHHGQHAHHAEHEHLAQDQHPAGHEMSAMHEMHAATHADMDVAMHDAGAQDGLHDGSHDGQHAQKSSTCSACAACCFGAVAPPPAVAWKPDLVRATLAFTPASVRRAGHIPASLERPPRSLSA